MALLAAARARGGSFWSWQWWVTGAEGGKGGRAAEPGSRGRGEEAAQEAVSLPFSLKSRRDPEHMQPAVLRLSPQQLRGVSPSHGACRLHCPPPELSICPHGASVPRKR